MIALKSVEYPCLDDVVIKSFTQNRILTILDLLQEDVEKLTAISKLSVQQITSLKKYILNKFIAVPINGSMFLQNTSKKYIKTHIENLDILLDGGIPVGFITEICGLADTGKSQLCIQTAINVSSDGESNILYVDTKRDFSAVRVQRILDYCGYSHNTMASIMHRIKVTYVWTMCELVSLMSKIQEKSLYFENLSLIIIDSLPCLMLQFLGDENKHGLTLLNELVNKLRYISKELHVGIFCVNIQTRWVDQDVVEVEDGKHSSTSNIVTTGKKNRCLGRYWHFIPAIVLLLERNADEQNISQIKVTLARSLQAKDQNTCLLKMCHSGIK